MEGQLMNDVAGSKRPFPTDTSQEIESSQSKRKKFPTNSAQLRERLEVLVSEINAKRKRDSDLFEEMKKEFEAHMNSGLALIEESLFGRYNKTNKVVEQKIQEFMALLSRIEQHENDLEEFERAHSVFKDMLTTVED